MSSVLSTLFARVHVQPREMPAWHFLADEITLSGLDDGNTITFRLAGKRAYAIPDVESQMALAVIAGDRVAARMLADLIQETY